VPMGHSPGLASFPGSPRPETDMRSVRYHAGEGWYRVGEVVSGWAAISIDLPDASGHHHSDKHLWEVQ
jgi:hypothetical protein